MLQPTNINEKRDLALAWMIKQLLFIVKRRILLATKEEENIIAEIENDLQTNFFGD